MVRQVNFFNFKSIPGVESWPHFPYLNKQTNKQYVTCYKQWHELLAEGIQFLAISVCHLHQGLANYYHLFL